VLASPRPCSGDLPESLGAAFPLLYCFSACVSRRSRRLALLLRLRTSGVTPFLWLCSDLGSWGTGFTCTAPHLPWRAVPGSIVQVQVSRSTPPSFFNHRSRLPAWARSRTPRCRRRAALKPGERQSPQDYFRGF
jgi:hypothetical protein